MWNPLLSNNSKAHHLYCPFPSVVISIYINVPGYMVPWLHVRFSLLNITITPILSSLPEAKDTNSTSKAFWNKKIPMWCCYIRPCLVVQHTSTVQHFVLHLEAGKHPLVWSPDFYLYTYMQINHSHKLRGHTNHVENDQLQIQSRHRQDGDEHEVDTRRQIINR